MQGNDEESYLDIFFQMIDLIEDDIAEILADEKNQLNEHECLVICFNRLKLYCRQTGIKFSQMEDHYNAFEESNTKGSSLNFISELNLGNDRKVEDFCKVLEEVENCLTVFEQRCEKTGELFDEWNCVFIMYSCLKKYCDRTKTNYVDLMNDVSKLQDDIQINEDSNGSINH